MAGRGCGYGDLINVGHFDLSEPGFSAVWGETRRANCGVHSQLGAEWIRMQNVELRSLAVPFTTCLFYWNEYVVSFCVIYIWQNGSGHLIRNFFFFFLLISAVCFIRFIIRFRLPFFLMNWINLILPVSCFSNQRLMLVNLISASLALVLAESFCLPVWKHKSSSEIDAGSLITHRLRVTFD